MIFSTKLAIEDLENRLMQAQADTLYASIRDLHEPVQTTLDILIWVIQLLVSNQLEKDQVQEYPIHSALAVKLLTDMSQGDAVDGWLETQISISATMSSFAREVWRFAGQMIEGDYSEIEQLDPLHRDHVTAMAERRLRQSDVASKPRPQKTMKQAFVVEMKKARKRSETLNVFIESVEVGRVDGLRLKRVNGRYDLCADDATEGKGLEQETWAHGTLEDWWKDAKVD